MNPPNLVTLLGPTAVGKTHLAARLAHSIGGEVISADSRQVFRGMDIGTGKDRSDYEVEGRVITSYLIDIADAGSEYSVYSFTRDFLAAYNHIVKNKNVPLLCGGTGLYLEAVLKGYNLVEVPENIEFRKNLEPYTDDSLREMLREKRSLHNTTDSLVRSRIIRALEIESYKASHHLPEPPDFSGTVVFGLRFERESLRKRITKRLHSRLENGMVEEVEQLLKRGVPALMLKYYGLEYKYITMYLQGEINYDEMVSLLNTAIHQFSKRQMTWFRRMERNGVKIHWLEGEMGPERNLIKMLSILSKG